MKRRNLLGALCSFPATLPATLWAQGPSNVARIGIIDGDHPYWEYFRNELRNLGRIEGRSVAFDYVIGGGTPDLLTAAATKLVRIPVDVIAASGTPRCLAAHAATKAIPIVAISIGEPVKAGFAASLAHPGGNVTGTTSLGPDIAAKRLQLLKELVPHAVRVACLWNPGNPSNILSRPPLEIEASKLGLTLLNFEARNATEIIDVLPAMMAEQPDAFTMSSEPMLEESAPTIVGAVAVHRVPAVFQNSLIVVNGGLFSYGPDFSESFRRAANQTHLILNGAKPADLPFERPTKLELAINLGTARSLNLTIPPAILTRADKVVE